MADPSLDEVRVELAEIGKLLDELPGDVLAKRVTLRQRQTELRAPRGGTIRQQSTGGADPKRASGPTPDAR